MVRATVRSPGTGESGAVTRSQVVRRCRLGAGPPRSPRTFRHVQYCLAPKPAPRAPQLKSGFVCGMNSSRRVTELLLGSLLSLEAAGTHLSGPGWVVKREMPDPGLWGKEGLGWSLRTASRIGSTSKISLNLLESQGLHL